MDHPNVVTVFSAAQVPADFVRLKTLVPATKVGAERRLYDRVKNAIDRGSIPAFKLKAQPGNKQGMIFVPKNAVALTEAIMGPMLSLIHI